METLMQLLRASWGVLNHLAWSMIDSRQFALFLVASVVVAIMATLWSWISHGARVLRSDYLRMCFGAGIGILISGIK